MVPRRDDDDDIIEIDFDDEDQDQLVGPSADHQDDANIEIVLLDDPTPGPVPAPPQAPTPDTASPPQPSRRRPPATPPPVPRDEPEPEQKYCQVCGFALRPLDATCPRCERLGTAPAAATTSRQPDLPPAEPHTTYPAAAPGRTQSRAPLIIGALVILAIAIAIPLYLLNSPGYRAAAAYREAVQAHLAGDMETARTKYLEALEYDPDMGLAAFGMGATYLGISVAGAPDQHMRQLLDAAIAGDTTQLDQADHWFDHAIVLANRMPPDKSLVDERLSTPPKLASHAHAMKALTAFMRYWAALLADDFDLASRWITIAGEQVRQSLAFDPTNPSAREIGDRVPK